MFMGQFPTNAPFIDGIRNRQAMGTSPTETQAEQGQGFDETVNLFPRVFLIKEKREQATCSCEVPFIERMPRVIRLGWMQDFIDFGTALEPICHNQ